MERGSRLGVFSLCMSCQRLLPVRFGTAPHVVTHMNAPFRSYSLWYEQREGRGQDALASPLRTKQNSRVSRQLPVFSHRSGWIYCGVRCTCKGVDFRCSGQCIGEVRSGGLSERREGGTGTRPAASFSATLKLRDTHRCHPGNIISNCNVSVVVSSWLLWDFFTAVFRLILRQRCDFVPHSLLLSHAFAMRFMIKVFWGRFSLSRNTSQQ